MELTTYVALVFIMTALISFSVSLQAGPVSLSVMRFAMHKQKDAALWAAVGGSLAELFYAGLAVLTAELLYGYIKDWSPMAYIGPTVMIGFGAYLLLSADRKFLRGRRTSYNKGQPLLTGLRLGLKNPQVYLFYCGLLLAYFQFGFKPAAVVWRAVSFSFGAMIGFMLLLILLIYLINRQGKISNHQFRGSKIMNFCGIIMLLAGIVQLVMAAGGWSF